MSYVCYISKPKSLKSNYFWREIMSHNNGMGPGLEELSKKCQKVWHIIWMAPKSGFTGLFCRSPKTWEEILRFFPFSSIFYVYLMIIWNSEKRFCRTYTDAANLSHMLLWCVTIFSHTFDDAKYGIWDFSVSNNF